MGEEEETVRLNLRLPASLHRTLQERAREHHRSLNSEIIDTLRLERLERDQLREINERMTRLEDLSANAKKLTADMLRVKDEIISNLPVPTRELIANTERAAKLRGKSFTDLFDEALRRIVDEESQQGEGVNPPPVNQ
jgi:hypothetical protein